MRGHKIFALLLKKRPSSPSPRRVTEQVNVKLPNGTDITFAWTPKSVSDKA